MVSGVGGPRVPRRGLGGGGPDELEGVGGAESSPELQGIDDLPSQQDGVDGVGQPNGIAGADRAFDAAGADMERGLEAQDVLGQDDPSKKMRFEFHMKREEYEWWLGDDKPWKDIKPNFGKLKMGIAKLQEQMKKGAEGGGNDTGMTDPSLTDPAQRMQKDLERTLEEQRRMGVGGVVAQRYDDPTRG